MKPSKIILGISVAVALAAGLLFSPAGVEPAFGQSAGQINVVAPLTRDNGALQTLTNQGVGTATSADMSGFNVTRVICVYRQATSTSGGGGTGASSTFSIQNKDAASGQYYSLVTSTPIASPTSVNFIAAGGDLSNTTNVSAALPIARTWRTSITVGGSSTPNVTGTIGCSIQ